MGAALWASQRKWHWIHWSIDSEMSPVAICWAWFWGRYLEKCQWAPLMALMGQWSNLASIFNTCTQITLCSWGTAHVQHGKSNFQWAELLEITMTMLSALHCSPGPMVELGEENSLPSYFYYFQLFSNETFIITGSNCKRGFPQVLSMWNANCESWR